MRSRPGAALERPSRQARASRAPRSERVAWPQEERPGMRQSRTPAQARLRAWALVPVPNGATPWQPAGRAQQVPQAGAKAQKPERQSLTDPDHKVHSALRPFHRASLACGPAAHPARRDRQRQAQVLPGPGGPLPPCPDPACAGWRGVTCGCSRQQGPPGSQRPPPDESASLSSLPEWRASNWWGFVTHRPGRSQASSRNSRPPPARRPTATASAEGSWTWCPPSPAEQPAG